MSEKMFEIKGRQISEQTIVEALKAHCGFEEKPKFCFQVDFLFGGEREDRNKNDDFPYYISTRINNPDNSILSAREMFSESHIEKIIENLQKMIGD